MNWEHILTVAGVNMALIGAFTTAVIWAVNKIDADVKSIGARMDKSDDRFNAHAQRIDQLYKMFVDLLKEKK